jgi:hypothetical protein
MAQAAHRAVGSRKTVCGFVAGTRYVRSSRGRPTFLNFERPYPDQVFTVVIWEEDRSAFADPPERLFDQRRACATGTVSEYEGVPQISSPQRVMIID